MQPADHVTGLATRGELQATLERVTSDSLPVALAICDVVGLKAVNEREGFLAGDATLRRAADRMRLEAADAALVARLGGDELVAVFTGPGSAATAARVAATLSGTASPPLRTAAVTAAPGEAPGPLVERLYAAMRRS